MCTLTAVFSLRVYQTSLRRTEPLSSPPITHIWLLKTREVWRLRPIHWDAAVCWVQEVPEVEYQTSLQRVVATQPPATSLSNPPITHIWLLKTREVWRLRPIHWDAAVCWVQEVPVVEYQTS